MFDQKAGVAEASDFMRDLTGKRILVTAGPTQEAIDATLPTIPRDVWGTPLRNVLTKEEPKLFWSPDPCLFRHLAALSL